MNILFISECYPDENNPQYCVYLEQQAKALVNLGAEVDVLVPAFSACKDPELSTKTYNGLKIFNALIKSGKLKKIIPFYSLKDTLDKFDFKKYDAVSLHIVSNGLSFRIANICKKQGVPVVTHFHGLNVWKDYIYPDKLSYKILWYYNHILKMLYLNKMSGIVGVSNKVCEIVKSKINKIPVFTVYNGVDGEKFFAKETDRNNGDFAILCVANLIKIKGHEYLIKAVSQLKKDGKKIRLQLIGTGPEQENLKEKCKSLGIDDNVEFLGVQKYDVVARYMSSADMFIMPSYFEALGCVYLESMSTGLLTCGCFGTGADEIIDDKIDGILVNQKSTQDIYDAILFAMENSKQANEIAQKGIEKAARFSWDASAESLLEVYKSIMQ